MFVGAQIIVYMINFANHKTVFKLIGEHIQGAVRHRCRFADRDNVIGRRRRKRFKRIANGVASFNAFHAGAKYLYQIVAYLFIHFCGVHFIVPVVCSILSLT